MSGSILTESGYVACAGISLVYAHCPPGDDVWRVMVRTTATLNDLAVIGMTASDEAEAKAYAEQVAINVWGSATSWTDEE